MIVNKRKKQATEQQRLDLMPKDLTREQTYQAFNFEIEMRLDSIDVLENTQENLKIEDNIQRCLI